MPPPRFDAAYFLRHSSSPAATIISLPFISFSPLFSLRCLMPPNWRRLAPKAPAKRHAATRRHVAPDISFRCAAADTPPEARARLRALCRAAARAPRAKARHAAIAISYAIERLRRAYAAIIFSHFEASYAALADTPPFSPSLRRQLMPRRASRHYFIISPFSFIFFDIAALLSPLRRRHYFTPCRHFG
jgi:hypothetical protein